MIQESSLDLEWQIVNRVKETPDTYTYTFSPLADSKFEFEVGQFVTISAYLRRPTESGALDESIVERAYSIASSPTRDLIDLTIKDEKSYGFINSTTRKADGFSAYFFEQIKIGDKVKARLNQGKSHFLSKVAAGTEKDIAYWSGSNGAESARCLLQFMEDTKDPDLYLTLFYSNPKLYKTEGDQGSLNIIYYRWLIEMAKKVENFRVVFTFTREKEGPHVSSEHPRIVHRTGRFFVVPKGNSDGEKVGGPERTLSKYYNGDVSSVFNPVCGSSGFINGTVKSATTGKILKGRGIIQDLVEIEGVKPEKIDKEQYYLQYVP
jgi:NAD(P)H-flavin reductase